MKLGKGYKVCICICLVTIICTVLPHLVFAAEGTLAGSGTAADPYVITSADDWKVFTYTKLRDGINEAVEENHVKIVADINFTDDFKHYKKIFCGVIDGGGHTITGLTAPLFYGLRNAVVKNIVVEAVNFNVGDGSSETKAGVIASSAENSTIEACYVSGNIECKFCKFGGIIGIADGETSILNCMADVNIHETKTKTIAGGLVGMVSAARSRLSIESCVAAGTITSKGTAGGLIGTVSMKEEHVVTIADSAAVQTKLSASYNAGKIIGAVSGDWNGSLKNTYARSEMTGLTESRAELDLEDTISASEEDIASSAVWQSVFPAFASWKIPNDGSLPKPTIAKPRLELTADAAKALNITEPCTLIAAAYGGNSLLDIQLFSIDSDETVDISKLTGTGSAECIRVMLWKDTLGIQPMCMPRELKLQ